MERAHLDLPHLVFAEQLPEPLLHLEGRLVREGDGTYGRRCHAMFRDEVRNARGQYFGLSASWACEDLERDVRRVLHGCNNMSESVEGQHNQNTRHTV